MNRTVKKVCIIKRHRKTVKWRRKNYWPFYSRQNAYQVGKDQGFKNTSLKMAEGLTDFPF